MDYGHKDQTELPCHADLIPANALIVVAPNEETANRLVASGIAATAAGTSGWKHTWTSLFKGKRVAVLEESGVSGYLAAAFVVSCLYRHAADICVVSRVDDIAWPGLKADIFDLFSPKTSDVQKLSSHASLYCLPKRVELLSRVPVNPIGSQGLLVWASQVRFMMAKQTFEPADRAVLSLHFEALVRASLSGMENSHRRVQLLKEWAYFCRYVKKDNRAAAIVMAEAVQQLIELRDQHVPYPDPAYGYEQEAGWLTRFMADLPVPDTAVDSLPPAFGPLEASLVAYYRHAEAERMALNLHPGKLDQRDSVLITIPFKADHANGVADLRILLDAIKKQTYRGRIVVHVAEGSGEPEARQLCEEAGVSYSHTPVEFFDANILRNKGPATVQDTDWLIWIDQDMVLHPRYVEYMLSRLVLRYRVDKPEHVIIRGGRENTGKRHLVPSFLREDIPWELFISKISAVRWLAMSGNNVITHRWTYNMLGGWWEEMKYWGHEDLEFFLRAWCRGVQLEMAEVTMAYHLMHLENEYVSDTHKKNVRLLLERHTDALTDTEKGILLNWKHVPLHVERVDPLVLRVYVTHVLPDCVYMSVAGSRGLRSSEVTWTVRDQTGTEIFSGTGTKLVMPTPGHGHYNVKAVAKRADGVTDSAGGYFDVGDTVRVPRPDEPPGWARKAVVYQVLPGSFTRGGTFSGVRMRLDDIQALGVNTILLSPPFFSAPLDNAKELFPRSDCPRAANGYPIDLDCGYTPTDFYRVNPDYGTEQDFRDLVQAIHSRGMKILLDFPVNHVGPAHPIVQDLLANGEKSKYFDWCDRGPAGNRPWGYMDLNVPGHGLWSYYFIWELPNWNWQKAEARQYMIDVMCHWVDEYDIDGYRLDMYWGPVSRYYTAEISFGMPIRAALKRKKPGVLLIGELDGLSEGDDNSYCRVVYAEQGGGVDVTYDWPAMWLLVRAFLADNTEGLNWLGAVPPAPHGMALRFLENHDEMRVASCMNSIEKTLPLATLLLTASGIPMLYAGQEVGFGYGKTRYMGMRAQIDWDPPWKDAVLAHYKKLLVIRTAFAPMTSRLSARVACSLPKCFAYARKGKDSMAIVLVNLSSEAAEPLLTIKQTVAGFSRFKMTALYAGQPVGEFSFTGPDFTFNWPIKPYGSEIFYLESV